MSTEGNHIATVLHYYYVCVGSGHSLSRRAFVELYYVRRLTPCISVVIAGFETDITATRIYESELAVGELTHSAVTALVYEDVVSLVSGLIYLLADTHL